MILDQLNTEGLTTVSLSKDELLLKQGEPGDQVFVLIHGQLTCTLDGYEVATITEPGTILGEVSAILGSPCTATVRASDDCEFYRFRDFEQLLAASPDVGRHVYRTLAKRLVNMNENFQKIKKVADTLQLSVAQVASRSKTPGSEDVTASVTPPIQLAPRPSEDA